MFTYNENYKLDEETNIERFQLDVKSNLENRSIYVSPLSIDFNKLKTRHSYTVLIDNFHGADTGFIVNDDFTKRMQLTNRQRQVNFVAGGHYFTLILFRKRVEKVADRIGGDE